MIQILKVGIFAFFIVFPLQAAVYHVETNGADKSDRDGLSTGKAWLSLAYACEKAVTAGDTIQIGKGTFTESRSCVLNNGLTVLGQDTSKTFVMGSGTWALHPDKFDFENHKENYIIFSSNKKNIKVGKIAFTSADTSKRMDGAFWAGSSNGIELFNCKFTEFAVAGSFIHRSSNVHVHHNLYLNASIDRCKTRKGGPCALSAGQILMRWNSNVEVNDNIITNTKGEGYGYKSFDGGHRNAKIHHNKISGHYFSIESAADHERNLEIYENELGGCISIPKFEGGTTKLDSGVQYQVRIHHNLMHDSYGIEGSRNFLIVDSNYVYITKTGGRFYTQFDGTVLKGPVTINHNVIINVDRALAWAGSGEANSISFLNNTIFCAVAGSRKEAVIAFPNKSSGWKFMNNLVVAPREEPRVFYRDLTLGAKVVDAKKNIFVNVSNIPEGNWVEQNPGLLLSGSMPYPYYSIKDATGPLVDKGLDVGYPYLGKAPDIGAYEYGTKPSTIVTKPKGESHRVISLYAKEWDLLGRPQNKYNPVFR